MFYSSRREDALPLLPRPTMWRSSYSRRRIRPTRPQVVQSAAPGPDLAAALIT